jgi:hypothetical protein
MSFSKPEGFVRTNMRLLERSPLKKISPLNFETRPIEYGNQQIIDTILFQK